MYMKDWIEKLNGFLTLNDRDILTHAGKVSHELALQKAEKEYDDYHLRSIQLNDKTDQDFEKAIHSHPIVNIKRDA